MSDAELLASNPATPAATLAELVQTNPEVQALVAANPAAYPGLLEWLTQYGGPEAQLVAKQRLATSMQDQELAPEPTSTNEQAGEDAESDDADAPAPVETESVATEELVFPGDEVVETEATLTQAAVPVSQEPLPTATAYTPPTQPASTQPQPQPTPLPVATGSESATGAGGRSPWPAALGALAGVLLAFLIGALFWFFLIRDATPEASVGEQSAADQEESQNTAAEAAAEEQRLEEERAELEKLKEEAEKAQEEAEAQNLFPAPANAVSAPWFVAPSTNIACKLDTTGAWCTIYEASFSVSGGSCTSTPYTVHAGPDGAQWDCSAAPIPNDSDAPVLEYSTSSTAANAACTSTSRGMTCWDTATGSSFAIARDGFVFGSNGVIPETEFPWR